VFTTTFAAATTTTAASLSATELTATTSASLEVAAATAASTGALTGSLAVELGVIELDELLGLALTLALVLASGSGDEYLLLVVAGNGFALGEFLGAALVGLADVLGSKRQFLLGELGEVGSIRLGLLLLFSSGSLLRSRLSGLILLILLGNSLASLLVGPLGVAVLSTPAMGSLLLMLAVRS
jgi:hypothetical protein